MESISILIKPSSSLCNLHCRYCFYHDVANNREISNRGFMNYQTVDNIINKVFKLKVKFVSFFFQGGEPTLIGIDFYKYFISKVNTINLNNIVKITYSIQTNGISLNDEWFTLFKENNFLVGISLDGVKEIHDNLRGNGTYNLVKKSITGLKKNQIEFNILIVVTKYIAKHYSLVYNKLKNNGYNYLQFIPCLDDFIFIEKDFSLSVEDYGDFLVGLYKLWKKDFDDGVYISIRLFDNIINHIYGKKIELCSFNGKCSCQFVIEGDGTVYPCDFYCLDKYDMGNINNNGFEELFLGDNCQSFLEFNSNNHIKEKCQKCEYFGLCLGGCRRENEKENFCDSYKRLYKEILRSKK